MPQAVPEFHDGIARKLVAGGACGVEGEAAAREAGTTFQNVSISRLDEIPASSKKGPVCPAPSDQVVASGAP
jgi:hypothetical protein